MGELGALFNPGMRHELEERQAKAARREEEGNAKDGDLRIDLESGVAVINAPGSDDDAEPAPESDNEGSAAAAGDGNDSGPTPAAQHDPDNESVSRDVSVRPALRPRGKRGLSASNR